MFNFRIIIDYKESAGGDSLAWEFESDGFPPSHTTLIGILHRVATLLIMERTGVVELEQVEETEDEE